MLVVRSTPRPRRRVGTFAFFLARPFFRHSLSRNAYVLRLVGNERGPVLVPDRIR
jgi:hypothetical protein